MRARRQRWITAAVVIAALAQAGTAHALVPPLRSNPDAMPTDVRRQFTDGKKAYDAQEFARAAKGFAAALHRVPDTPVNRSVRAFLVVDAMVAYQEAFEVGEDIEMLRAGMEVYYGYFKSYRDVHGSTNIPQVVVEQRFAMKETLARAESRAKGNGPTTTTTTTTSTGTTTGTTAADPQPVAADDDRGRKPRERNRDRSGPADGGTDRSKALIVSGAVNLALGVGLSSLIAVGAINGKRAREDQKNPGFTPEQRERIDQQGRTANALFISGLVLTPLFIAAGATLLGKGVSDRRKAQLSLAPSVTPRFAGVVLRGRF